jgi:hypothetical protein
LRIKRFFFEKKNQNFCPRLFDERPIRVFG